jgi:tRNA-dihydrouridine synthase
MNIWEELASAKPFFALAPMEAVTDVVFRHVVARAARPDVFFTEFTNTSSFASPLGHASTRGRLEFTPDEMPIIPQIWGSRPADFEVTAAGLREMGYTAIDINMGCPDKAVIKSGGGSDLIRHPELAAEIIAATKTAGLPVSVKTRLGYSGVGERREWLGFLLAQDLACLTVHLRTRKEMSKVPVHIELIDDIVALRDKIAPHTLLMINGDIADRAAGEQLAHQHPGVDGIMIGRGVFANPFCFESTPRKHSREELVQLLEFHLDEFDRAGERKFDPLKRFFKIYINNFPGASDLRTRLMDTKTTDEARAVLAELAQ